MLKMEQTTSLKTVCNCSAPAQTDQPSSLSSNGGLIAMAAGLSIVIPLVCVIVMQLRRAKVAERERMRIERVSRETARRDQIRDSPPEYEVVFGDSFTYPVVIPSNNSPPAVSYLESDLVQPGNGTTDNESERRLTNSETYQHETILNIPDHNASISTVSDDNIVDNSSSYNQDYHQTDETLYQSDSTVTSITTLDSSGGSSSDSHTYFTPSSSIELLASTSSLSSASSVPSVDIPHSPTQNGSNNRTPLAQRVAVHHPGMHISVLDFFEIPVGVTNNGGDTPPPSYEEALQILESALLHKAKENIIDG